MTPALWQPINSPITAEALPDALREHKAVVLRFWVTWDISGRRLDAWLQEMSPEFGKSLAFYSVDVDAEAAGLAARYGILSTPALVLLLNRGETVRSAYILSKEELAMKLQEWREAAEKAA